MADVPQRRAELMAPYRRPVRHCAGEVWRRTPAVRYGMAVAVVCVVGGGLGVVLGETLLTLLLVAALLILLYLGGAWAYLTAAETLQLVRAWRQRSMLRDVLERRPHAGSEDPDLAHDLFAVTVQDDGWLYTWRYRPLAWDEEPGLEDVEVQGRPRYAAEVVDERRFDARDAAVAAEQLVAAQDGAAKREAWAAAEASAIAERADLDADELEEARSTAAALQRSTGQRSRRS